MLVAGKISFVRFVTYVLVQCCGAVAGTAALRALLPEDLANIGHTNLAANIVPMQGLGIEYFLGFVLVFCVFGVCDANKPDHRFIAPLTIGLTVTLGHLAAIRFTGASMNPARTFGTALVQGVWQNHWVNRHAKYAICYTCRGYYKLRFLFISRFISSTGLDPSWAE